MQSPAEVSRDGVAALYVRSCPRLIGVLASIGGSRTEAEDVAQDAYVRLLQHWSKVQSYDDPEAWVRAVAVRLLISRQRRARVASLGLIRLRGEAKEAQSDVLLDGVAISVALRSLPVSQRAVVVLHHVLDLPVGQVANELQVPVGTVKSRLSRGRAALAALLHVTEEALNV
jgi:RNA polymerase sigma-70 factor (ECF subfamily)